MYWHGGSGQTSGWSRDAHHWMFLHAPNSAIAYPVQHDRPQGLRGPSAGTNDQLTWRFWTIATRPWRPSDLWCGLRRLPGGIGWQMAAHGASESYLACLHHCWYIAIIGADIRSMLI